MSISLKTPEDIEGMRVAGRLAAEVLDFITPFVKPGVTTGELDRLCHEYMVNVQGTVPAPLNYAPPGYPPYPKVDLHLGQRRDLPRHPGRQGAEERRRRSTSTSPSSRTAITATPAACSSSASRRSRPSACREITYECMWLGIAKVRPGAHLGDIGHAIQQHAEKNGYSVVREFCGHGIGQRVPRGAAGAALRPSRHRHRSCRPA